MLQHLIETYGVIAILLGAAIEGETAAFLGGVIAHRHLVAYWQVATAAAAGSFAADQIIFLIGRRFKDASIVKRLTDTPALKRVTTLLETYPVGFILAFRFISGMRTISPITIGLSKVPTSRFLVLNFIAAATWGVLITGVGFLFGNAVEVLVGRLHLHLHLLIAFATAVAVLIVATLVSRRYLKSRLPLG